MVLVNPSGKTTHEVGPLLVSGLKTNPASSGVFVTLHLDEPLKIEFSISRAGTLSRDLRLCRCHTTVLPKEQLRSLNNAYQKISALLEPHRISHGGKVYEKVYFKDSDNFWKLLEVLRERIYRPYQAEFEEHLRVINEKIEGYIRPHSDTKRSFGLEIQEKEKLLEGLLSQAIDHQKQIELLSTLLEKSKLVVYRQKLEEFKLRLESNYHETSGPDSWQEWIYKNTWIFGIQYGNPIGHPQVGFRSILDYLFPTPDGFVDILEIKRPAHKVIKEDKSHPGALKWSNEVNEAIGQVVHYLHEIELHQLEIAKRIKQEPSLELSAIKPRAFILIGRSDELSNQCQGPPYSPG